MSAKAPDSSDKGDLAGSIAAHGPMASIATCDATSETLSTSGCLLSQSGNNALNHYTLEMADEPTLPPLPSGTAENAPFSDYNPITNRRPDLVSHHSYSHVSSDGPMFSSDDDPGLENYMDQGRTKKRSRGPWFKQESSKPVESGLRNDGEKRRKLERQKDSGVYMGSDGANDSDNNTPSNLPVFAGSLPTLVRPRRMRIVPRTLSPEEQVQRYIARCLDRGQETIDLSNRNLFSLSNATIKPLNSLTPVPKMHDGIFLSIAPSLQIFVAQNKLEEVPGELFNLEHLSVLSVRNNQIKELPAAISRLQNIKELNVANNMLRWLPYELMSLNPLTDDIKINIFPNAFFSPSIFTHPVLTRLQESLMDHSTTAYLFRSPVRFFDKWGKMVKGCRFPTDDSRPIPPENPTRRNRDYKYTLIKGDNSVEVAEDDDVPMPPDTEVASRSPTLTEICLRTYASLPPAMLASAPTDVGNETFNEALHRARKVIEAETVLPRCTICDKEYVFARTEWIEWHLFGRRKQVAYTKTDLAQSQVPLLRRGCSWLCVPGPREDLVEVVDEKRWGGGKESEGRGDAEVGDGVGVGWTA